MEAKGFYGVYIALIAISAGLVLTPGAPLGLLTNAVQTPAGLLLPSATVFLLLLCNDREVLGPWVNSRGMNLFTGAVIAVPFLLSVILTASVRFPEATGVSLILAILGVGGLLAVVASVLSTGSREARRTGKRPVRRGDREIWRMPPLEKLPSATLSTGARMWMGVLRVYLVVAGGMVLSGIVMLAFATSG